MIITSKTRTIALLLLASCMGIATAQAQPDVEAPLTLERCYLLAADHYPLIRQQGLIEKTRAFTMENAARGYWPQLVVAGQASYQSAVTKLPVFLPDVQSPSLSKDQYRLYGEVSQALYDNGVIRNQQELAAAQAQTELQRVEASLYGLRERINQLFFGVLMTDARLRQVSLLRTDLQSALDRVDGAIKNGTALRSNAEVLRAQLLQTDQRSIELLANRRAYIGMLSIFIGQSVSDSGAFAEPRPPALTPNISRPELRLYEAQKTGIYAQEKLLKAKAGPRLGLFLQGGVGRPALNFLSNEVEPYYLGGLRLNWNIGSYYTLRRERQVLQLSAEGADVQRDIFLLNTQLGMQQYTEDIRRLQSLLATDEQIVALRGSIKTVASAQLSNGVITANDFLREANAEDQARQDEALHRLQLLLAQFNYQTTAGN